ncbi:MAG: hypothetical protein ABJL57_05435 [Hyphomonas sp.]|jgi:hypothetical protein|uniref:hypothetical protein n=1 Tax=Hyphomonas sp. TaxID=87 RepID=UPI0032650C5C
MRQVISSVAGMFVLMGCAATSEQAPAVTGPSECMGGYIALSAGDSVKPFDSGDIREESEVEEACPDESEIDVTATPDDE